MSFEAGAITGALEFDISDFARGMLQADAIAAAFPQVVTSFIANPILGAINLLKDFATAAVDAFKSAASEADNMGEAAQRAGVGVQWLTTVGLAAKDAGSSVEGLGEAIKFLNRNMSEANGGSEEAAAKFARLGIAYLDASGNMRRSEDVFNDLADAMQDLGNSQDATASAMDLLGRGGADMLPLLKQGSAAINEQAELFKSLGGGISESMAAAGDKVGTITELIFAALKGLRNAFAEPILQAFADNFEAVKGTIVEFYTTLQPLFAQVGQWIAELIPPAIEFAQTVLGNWQAGMGPTIDLLGGLWEMLKGVASVIISVVMPAAQILEAVLRPIAIVIGVILEGLGKFLGFIGSGIGAIFGLGGLGVQAAGASSRTVTVTNHTNVSVGAIRSSQDADDLARRIAARQRSEHVKEGL